MAEEINVAPRDNAPEAENPASDTGRRRHRAAASVEDGPPAEDGPIDKTVPGGRYLVGADAHGRGGTLVDANGKEIKE